MTQPPHFFSVHHHHHLSFLSSPLIRGINSKAYFGQHHPANSQSWSDHGACASTAMSKQQTATAPCHRPELLMTTNPRWTLSTAQDGHSTSLRRLLSLKEHHTPCSPFSKPELPGRLDLCFMEKMKQSFRDLPSPFLLTLTSHLPTPEPTALAPVRVIPTSRPGPCLLPQLLASCSSPLPTMWPVSP